MKLAEKCKLLQCFTGSVQKWCSEDYIEINVFKTNMAYFALKINSIYFNRFLTSLLAVRTDCVKYLEIMLHCKLNIYSFFSFDSLNCYILHYLNSSEIILR
jgi:hypothetical protein